MQVSDTVQVCENLDSKKWWYTNLILAFIEFRIEVVQSVVKGRINNVELERAYSYDGTYDTPHWPCIGDSAEHLCLPYCS